MTTGAAVGDGPNHDPTAYGAHIAGDYDEVTGLLVGDTDAAVDALAELAGGGPVLELGVGTGRLALPLVARGLAVHGVEASKEMVDRLRDKPGGEHVDVTVGDFTDLQLDETFPLAVLAYNTVYALPTQDAQVACFATVAAHLRPGGRFVLDAWVPDPAAFRGGQLLRTLAVDGADVVLEAARLDPVAQRMTTTKVRLRGGQVRLFPANHRYVWPAELDLMGRLAEMRLEHRWGSWHREPFTASSTHHVSVYRLVEGAGP